jgi:hypothetical protein
MTTTPDFLVPGDVGAEIARHMGGQPNTASAQSSTLP